MSAMGQMLQKQRHTNFVLVPALISLVFFVPQACALEFEQLEQDLSLKQKDFKRLLTDFSSVLDELESTKTNLEKEKNLSAQLEGRVTDLGSRLDGASRDLFNKNLKARSLGWKLSEERAKSANASRDSEKFKELADKAQKEKFEQVTQLSKENGKLVENLHSERDRLKIEIDLLKKDLDDNHLVSENKALINRQKRLEGELKIATRQGDTLKNQISKLKETLAAKHAREKGAFGQKITQLDKSLAKKQTEMSDLQKTIKGLRTENMELGKTLALVKDKNRELLSGSTNVTLQFLQDRVAIEREVGGKLAEVKKLAVAKIKDKKTKMDGLQLERDSMSRRLAVLEAENLSMKGQINSLTAKMDKNKTKAKDAVQKLLKKLQDEQELYGKKLVRIKTVVGKKIEDKDEKLSGFGKKVEAMMAGMIEQKKKYSSVYQQLQMAQASIEAFKNRGLPIERVCKQDQKDQKASQFLAKNVEKLEEKVSTLQAREKNLFKELDVARSEAKILRTSIDQMHHSNENLIEKNDKLKTKLGGAENSLLSLKDKTRELTKREAELVDRVVNLEIQIASGAKSISLKSSKELDEKLKLAKVDYAKLRQEVETLVDKLGKSSQLADNLSHEASAQKDKICSLNQELENKDLQVVQLKDKVRSLLSNIGLDGDLLSHEKKTEYLRLVADHEMEKLTGSVLKTGKGKMEPSLKSLLDDDSLVEKMVCRLSANQNQQSQANTSGSFGKIFGKIHKNQLKAEMSKLYGFFLARASTGKAEDAPFRTFKKIAAKHFSDPTLEDVDIKSLADPYNPLMVRIES